MLNTTMSYCDGWKKLLRAQMARNSRASSRTSTRRSLVFAATTFSLFLFGARLLIPYLQHQTFDRREKVLEEILADLGRRDQMPRHGDDDP